MKYNQDENLERYLRYEMSLDERKAFEQEMDKEPKLKEKFLTMYLYIKAEEKEQDKQLQETLDSIGHKEFAEIMRNVAEKQQVPTIPIIAPHRSWRTRRIIIALSACAAILIVAFFIFKESNHTLDTQRIYSEYFSKAPAVGYSRSGGGLSAEDIRLNKRIIQSYELEEYSKVVDVYEQELSERENVNLPFSTRLLVAYSLMETGKEQVAILLLTQPEWEQSEYVQKAKWLLLGAYLKVRDIEKAEIMSQEIGEQGGFYAEKAREIYNELTKK